MWIRFVKESVGEAKKKKEELTGRDYRYIMGMVKKSFGLKESGSGFKYILTHNGEDVGTYDSYDVAMVELEKKTGEKSKEEAITIGWDVTEIVADAFKGVEEAVEYTKAQQMDPPKWIPKHLEKYWDEAKESWQRHNPDKPMTYPAIIAIWRNVCKKHGELPLSQGWGK